MSWNEVVCLPTLFFLKILLAVIFPLSVHMHFSSAYWFLQNILLILWLRLCPIYRTNWEKLISWVTLHEYSTFTNLCLPWFRSSVCDFATLTLHAFCQVSVYVFHIFGAIWKLWIFVSIPNHLLPVHWPCLLQPC